MTEAIAFPDAEAVAITYLKPLITVPVSTRVPNPRPTSFVRVVRVGGTRTNRITDRPMVVFECWAASETDASDLARTVRAYVGAMEQTSIGGAWVRSVDEIGGPQSFPDPDTNAPRYQFTVQLDLRGAVL